MFSKSLFQTLFNYHWHTTARLLDCTAQLSPADYHENPGYGHGSVHDLFFHLLRADWGWRMALETGKQLRPLRATDYTSFELIKSGFEQEQSAWQSLLEKLSPAEIEGAYELTNWKGEVFSMPYWRFLQHIVLHGMQHHAELAQLLTAKGQSPGNLDFIFFE